MHEVQQCLSYLKKKAETLSVLNPTQKEIILKDLHYFLTQAQCDLDRRNRHEVIHHKWKEFELKVRRTPLLQEPKGFFLILQDFLGLRDPAFSNKKDLERMEKFEVPDFLEDLIVSFESKKSFFSEAESNLVFCGLKFLLSEAKTPSLKRDQKSILKTWKIIKPILEKYGLFYKYTGAKGLSSKLRFFITRSL